MSLFQLNQTTVKVEEKKKAEKKKSLLFDFLNDLYYNKKNLLNADTIVDYKPFLINKFISGNIDTVLYAQEMNKRHWLDADMQHDYYLYSIPKKKRFSKYKKKSKEEDIEVLQKYYNYNYQRAKEVLHLHSEDELKRIRKILDVGGV